MNLIAKRRKWAMGPIAALIFFLAAGASQGTAQTKQPNILVIMGDDIGMWNIGAYHRGLMAGKTPNLVDQEKMKVDGTLGIRYWHLGENFSFQPSNLNNSQSANWVDAVAGARFLMPLSPKAMVMVLGDAGAGGANVITR